jgi:hypothetical protein
MLCRYWSQIDREFSGDSVNRSVKQRIEERAGKETERDDERGVAQRDGQDRDAEMGEDPSRTRQRADQRLAHVVVQLQAATIINCMNPVTEPPLILWMASRNSDWVSENLPVLATHLARGDFDPC